jgi:hypothetical protein
MVTAYIASRIVASALPTIMIVFPFDFIIAYMLVTIAWRDCIRRHGHQIDICGPCSIGRRPWDRPYSGPDLDPRRS